MADAYVYDPTRASHARVKSFRRCPRQFYYKYVMGIKKKTPAIQLKRGSWLHELLEVHYSGGDWTQRQAALEADFMELFEEEREEYGDLPAETNRIMTSYLQRWRKEDKGIKILAAELDEDVELPNGLTLNLIIDLLVEEADGGVWIWDHKTVKDFMDPSFMLVDAQLALYFWAAKKLGITNLRGILFNELITRPPTMPKVLQSGRLEQRANIRCDVYTYARAIRELDQVDQDISFYRPFLQKLMAKRDEWFRRTRLPKDGPLTQQVVKEFMMTMQSIKEATERERFPRTPDKSCTWGCDYLAPCSVQLQGGEIDNIVKLKFTTREEREEDGGY